MKCSKHVGKKKNWTYCAIIAFFYIFFYSLLSILIHACGLPLSVWLVLICIDFSLRGSVGVSIKIFSLFILTNLYRTQIQRCVETQFFILFSPKWCLLVQSVHVQLYFTLKCILKQTKNSRACVIISVCMSCTVISKLCQSLTRTTTCTRSAVYSLLLQICWHCLSLSLPRFHLFGVFNLLCYA